MFNFNKIKLIVILCLLFLLTACDNNEQKSLIKAKVNRVVSGQSLEVMIIDTPFKVRLNGIDAPDLKQNPWGEKAKQKLKELVDKKTIYLETNLDKKDRYNRIIAYVWQDDILINEELIAQGYVLANVDFINDKDTKRFRYAQDYARIMANGLWDNQQPLRLSPQEFRQKIQ